MKQTLLELVQDILLSMNSFDVNSISDTLEAEQVAKVVRTAYFDIIQQRDWAHLKRTIQLDATSPATPTHLKVPDNVKRVDYIAYNCKKDNAAKDLFQRLTFITPEQFLENSATLDSTASNVVQVTDLGGIPFLVRNDRQPMYWTTFDDKYIVCDSWYSTLDTHLQNSKSRAIVIKSPTWTHTDSFVPELPEDAFPYLLNEAKSLAWMELRGIPNEKAEQISNRHRRTMSQHGWLLDNQDRYKPKGRVKPGYTKNPYLEK